MPSPLPYQPSLFAPPRPTFDRTFTDVRRIALDPESWIDHAPGWVEGSDALFEELLASRRWGQRRRWMYDRKVLEPRLTAPWSAQSGEPLEPPVLEEIRRALSARYGVVLDSAGFNLYRDGADGVAWHGDRIRREIPDPIVALVSLGEPRKLLFRPRAGGHSVAFRLGRGDLLVTGGRTQRTWQHCVPKVARAGTRISVAFRHGLDPRGYGEPTETPEG
ncbi:alpha-ketoglutarate-dependent dioxygenase AlkB [Anaeromyxobacter oryzae]|uniref:Alkylated DNA repair protein n=1 Tax=Anaeromyxobacter oryzae TaxID=2918170 RepID=A0ABM7WP27_9BACT|nr:alpha-ketoglutarate-dependent dioxygenase AlkB [Anaeromyxobacter oryzae]BDG01219.1 alkylated DNA repair protein [Anaeromyxobacter oryzae]